MRQIRRGVFETNSSSVHSITMCTEEDFDKWVNGEFYYDDWNEKFVKEKPDNDEENRFLTYDQFFNDWGYIEYETYKKECITPGGEKIIAFGYYGRDC